MQTIAPTADPAAIRLLADGGETTLADFLAANAAPGVTLLEDFEIEAVCSLRPGERYVFWNGYEVVRIA